MSKRIKQPTSEKTVKKTLLLFGGNDGERHVSVASAKNLAENYDFNFYCYLHLSKIYFCSRDELLEHVVDFSSEFSKGKLTSAMGLEEFFARFEECLIFNALHGEFGEDGQLQYLLEGKGVSFTGSGSVSCGNCFDKRKSKQTVGELGVLIPIEFTSSDAKSFIGSDGDLIVKPNAGGSSLGVKYLISERQLSEYLQDPEYLVEEKIDGIELSCGVVDMGSGLVALPPIQIETSSQFDFDSKYLSSETRETEYIDSSWVEKVKSITVLIHEASGCKGYSRSDFIVSEDRLYFLEINSLPGLTKQSIFTKELELVNISIHDFISAQLSSIDIE
jgi:D-alanine-D-alanine ligase